MQTRGQRKINSSKYQEHLFPMPHSHCLHWLSHLRQYVLPHDRNMAPSHFSDGGIETKSCWIIFSRSHRNKQELRWPKSRAHILGYWFLLKHIIPTFTERGKGEIVIKLWSSKSLNGNRWVDSIVALDRNYFLGPASKRFDDFTNIP